MKKYEYTINLKELTCYQVVVIASDQEEAIEMAIEADRSDKELQWYDIDDVDIIDKELIGQW